MSGVLNRPLVVLLEPDSDYEGMMAPCWSLQAFPAFAMMDSVLTLSYRPQERATPRQMIFPENSRQALKRNNRVTDCA